MATVTKRGDSYRIRSSSGYDATGKQIVKTMTWTPDKGMTERQIAKELERQKVLFDEKVKSGKYIDGNIKFQDFAEKWFNDYAIEHLRTRTFAEYQRLSKRVYQEIGHVRLDRIQPHHLLEFYKRLEQTGTREGIKHCAKADIRAHIKALGLTMNVFADKAGVSLDTLKSACQGKRVSHRTAMLISQALKKPLHELFTPVDSTGKLAPKTIKHYHAFISSVMERAVKWQVIQENPCRRVDPPKVPRHDINCMDADEAIHFLECLESEPIQDKALFSLLLFTGLRRGEALGLEWGDVDFDTGIISVSRTSQYMPGKGTFEDTTKTEQSKRSFKVTTDILEILKSHRIAQNERRLMLGDQWKGSRRIFTNKDGGDMTLTVPYQRLKQIQDKYNLPAVSLHSLRHTNASLLIQQGVNIRTVSARLGHSQTSTTMNIYAHQLQSADAAAADAIGLALKPKKKQA